MKIKIHDLPGDPGRRQKTKRVGRGRATGQGTQAGKGHKGQKSRSGASNKGAHFEGGQMPITRRLPKFGFNNRFRIEYNVINVADLDIFEDGTEVTPELLMERRLVRRKNKPLKILGNGEITKKLTIKAQKFSKTAEEKIKSKGGTVEVVK